MDRSFLENLKNAIETGDLNSEAAKKIIEIDKLANNTTKDSREKFAKERENAVPVDNITPEEAIRLNDEYKMKMEALKLKDSLNVHIVNLVEIEELVKLSIGDMFLHVEELEEKFKTELNNNLAYSDLLSKITEIYSKYGAIYFENKSK